MRFVSKCLSKLFQTTCDGSDDRLFSKSFGVSKISRLHNRNAIFATDPQKAIYDFFVFAKNAQFHCITYQRKTVLRATHIWRCHSGAFIFAPRLAGTAAVQRSSDRAQHNQMIAISSHPFSRTRLQKLHAANAVCNLFTNTLQYKVLCGSYYTDRDLVIGFR